MSASVQHVHLHCNKDGYKFGQVAFNSIEELKRHFEVEKPVIGGESGVYFIDLWCFKMIKHNMGGTIISLVMAPLQLDYTSGMHCLMLTYNNINLSIVLHCSIIASHFPGVSFPVAKIS